MCWLRLTRTFYFVPLCFHLVSGETEIGTDCLTEFFNEILKSDVQSRYSATSFCRSHRKFRFNFFVYFFEQWPLCKLNCSEFGCRIEVQCKNFDVIALGLRCLVSLPSFYLWFSYARFILLPLVLSKGFWRKYVFRSSPKRLRHKSYEMH